MKGNMAGFMSLSCEPMCKLRLPAVDDKRRHGVFADEDGVSTTMYRLVAEGFGVIIGGQSRARWYFGYGNVFLRHPLPLQTQIVGWSCDAYDEARPLPYQWQGQGVEKT
ncbi:hypothetical protein K470DRAFT_263537 [Piedraia hortae CBS 480.64]|uniref:Uncharacterized protein n=1 Tax=Piedraia hortae CBS 480.64 TaxID=1314780 RepID=A0A6A7C2P0_9PEZI|nr:hypothetical protein K470DRAFT_263537 [Piedraia hortae CBS 480.64]